MMSALFTYSHLIMISVTVILWRAAIKNTLIIQTFTLHIIAMEAMERQLKPTFSGGNGEEKHVTFIIKFRELKPCFPPLFLLHHEFLLTNCRRTGLVYRLGSREEGTF